MSRKLISFITSFVFVLALASTVTVRVRAAGFTDSFDYATKAEFNSNWATYNHLPWDYSLSGGNLNITSSFSEFLTPGFSFGAQNGFVRSSGPIGTTWQAQALATVPFDSLHDSSFNLSVFAGADTIMLGVFNSLGSSDAFFTFGINGVMQTASITPANGPSKLTVLADGNNLGFYGNDQFLGYIGGFSGDANSLGVSVNALQMIDGAAFAVGKDQHVTAVAEASIGSFDGSAMPSSKVPDTGSTANMAIAGMVAVCFAGRLLRGAT